jgi:hypothetical protein
MSAREATAIIAVRGKASYRTKGRHSKEGEDQVPSQVRAGGDQDGRRQVAASQPAKVHDPLQESSRSPFVRAMQMQPKQLLQQLARVADQALQETEQLRQRAD